jgi:hypothetical protein
MNTQLGGGRRPFEDPLRAAVPEDADPQLMTEAVLSSALQAANQVLVARAPRVESDVFVASRNEVPRIINMRLGAISV